MQAEYHALIPASSLAVSASLRDILMNGKFSLKKAEQHKSGLSNKKKEPENTPIRASGPDNMYYTEVGKHRMV